MARLNDMYKAEVAPALMKKYSYKSVMQIPKFDKIVINVGAGDAKDNTKVIDTISSDPILKKATAFGNPLLRLMVRVCSSFGFLVNSEILFFPPFFSSFTDTDYTTCVKKCQGFIRPTPL